MNMKKVCPVCQHHNIPAAEFCSDCDQDLEGVPLIDVDSVVLESSSQGSVKETPGSEHRQQDETERRVLTNELPSKNEPEYYKECPNCHSQKPPLAMICDCTYDLSKVEVQHRAAPPSPPHFVRVCKCGVKNPVTASRCSRCGEDITLIPPVPDHIRKALWVLKIRGGQDSLHVADGQKFIIGKRGELSGSLQSNDFVSREHIEVSCVSGKLYISHRSRSNPTLVNGREISWTPTTVTELKNGDVVCLGNYPGQADSSRAGYLVVEQSN